MSWVYGYVIEFDDGGPPEHQLLGEAESEEECEQIAKLMPAVAYSGSRPVKQAILVWMPKDRCSCFQSCRSLNSSTEVMSLSDLVSLQQEYERKRTTLEICGTSWVQALQRGIVLNGVPHSGVVTHVCIRPQHPGNEPCQCRCGKKELIKK